MLQNELPDSELAQLAREEVARLEAEEKKFAQQIQFGLVPPNPTDSRNTIVEIRAGAGGSESALFAADLYRMFFRYAETRKWKIEPLDSNPSDLGGFKEIIFEVTGTDVFMGGRFGSTVLGTANVLMAAVRCRRAMTMRRLPIRTGQRILLPSRKS